MESYQIKEDSEIVLAFLEEPKNSLILTSRFLPNKVGGDPAWISELGIPSMKCEHCGYKLSFLMQLYANIDEEDPNLHRMLYVLTCLSPQCISEQRAIKVYRGYSEHIEGKFAGDQEFDDVYNSTDTYLAKMGLLQEKKEEDQKEEEQKEPNEQEIKEKGLIFDEYAIETDIEQQNVTQFYLKETMRLKHLVENKQQQDDDEEENPIEEAFLKNYANSQKDQKHIEKLAKVMMDKEDEDVDDENQERLDKVEMQELEKIIKSKHNNYAKIPLHYKLFENVAKHNPEQIARYVKNRHQSIIPLWMSEQNIPTQIPNCELCGSQRLFEFQIMPQIFDILPELMLVDWNTIVVYTCSNNNCIPDLSKGSSYIREHAYIQFSDDFKGVQYGDEQEIKNQQKLKQKEQEQLIVDPSSQDQKPESEEQKEEKKKKKKNKKKKDDKKDDKMTREEVNNEVQTQLQDLMQNFSLNPQQQQ